MVKVLSGVHTKVMEVSATVFDRGFTGSNGRARGGSTGIGLYLCKKLAGFLDVGLDISSVEGRGTTVTLTFPAKENLTEL